MKKVVRNRVIKVRLSTDELRLLDEKVAVSGMKSREEFCRACFENIEIRAAPPREFHVLITEVRRVGNNLNQVARRLNGYIQSDTPNSSEVNEAIKAVYDVVDLIYSDYED